MDYQDKYWDKYAEKDHHQFVESLSRLGAIIAPSFVLIWDLLIPGKPVPLIVTSWIISLFFTLIFLLKFISPVVKANLSKLFYFQCYVVTIYVVYLAYYNDFSKEYLLVHMLIVLYISLTIEKIGSLLSYLLTVFMLVGLATYADFNRNHVLDMSSILLCICLIIFSIIVIYHLKKRNESRRKLFELGHFDELTHLPNRNFLQIYIEHIIEDANLNGQTIALLFIDLDQFQNINDAFGQKFGDKALKHSAKELKAILQEDDFIARYGSDEFIVILEDTRLDRARHIARQIVDRFSKPQLITDQKINFTVSIGISVYPDDATSAETWVNHAYIALHKAKTQGRNHYLVFNRQLNDEVSRWLKLKTGLKSALENDELIVHYQPQIDFSTGVMTGVEALLRWKHPELGMIPPNEFIPLAEDTGLIIPIGEWILKTACQDRMNWPQKGLHPIHVAVNVSYRQLIHKDFIGSVQKALNESGLAPQYLELEITESVIRDADEFKIVLEELKTIGVMVAIDDFGVGYSSFSMLQHMVINNLKIDMSFIKGLPESSKTATIVKSIINLGKHLNCNITAEGVETEEQVQFLKENNCSIGQGYFFSKPLDINDFEKFLKS